MENKIRKALDYYSYANSLKYIDCILLDGKRISYASDIFSKYSIAVANYLESKDDYSLGEVIRYLSIFDTLPAIRKLSKSEENLTVASDFTSPYSKKSAKAQEVFSESLCLNLRKPVDKKSKFVLSNKKLMFEPRTGHIYWGVSAPKLETTAEHIYGTCSLAIALDSEFDLGHELDMDKVLAMLAVHETEEIKIGDTTEFDTSKKVKRVTGDKATNAILKGYKKGPEIQALLDEFNDRKTPEAIFAYLCDKMEYTLQVKIYEELGCYDFNNRPSNCCTESPRVKEIINNGADTVFQVHADYDKFRFKDNPIFEELLRYIRTNKILSEEEKFEMVRKINNF